MSGSVERERQTLRLIDAALSIRRLPTKDEELAPLQAAWNILPRGIILRSYGSGRAADRIAVNQKATNSVMLKFSCLHECSRS
jgi:hypothetical protein